MDGSESILETILEEESLDDVDMVDAESSEEGEIKSTEHDKASNQETNIESPRPPKPKRKKNKKKRNKPKSVSDITDVNRFVLDTCRRLKERKSYLVWNAVGCLGVSAVRDLVKEVDAILACGGQMTADGKRPRFGGGILWNILKTREPNAYKEIMSKGRELEKQLRKPNTHQGRPQAKDIHPSNKNAGAPSDLNIQPQDGPQCTSKVQEKLEPEPINDHQRRLSVLNRIRVPVCYDDLVSDEVKDSGSP